MTSVNQTYPRDDLRVGSEWFSYSPEAGATNGKGGTRNVAHARLTAVVVAVPYRGRFPTIRVRALALDGPNAGFAVDWKAEKFVRLWKRSHSDKRA